MQNDLVTKIATSVMAGAFAPLAMVKVIITMRSEREVHTNVQIALTLMVTHLGSVANVKVRGMFTD